MRILEEVICCSLRLQKKQDLIIGKRFSVEMDKYEVAVVMCKSLKISTIIFPAE
jgi:hypothetical protein